MKISGKFILKVAGTLTVISLVVAALLGLVDSVTRDKIAAIEAENTRIAMSAVVAEGSEFTDALELTDDVVAAAKAQGGTITFKDAVRFEKGEGIEKKQEDFAAEVAAQMNAGH